MNLYKLNRHILCQFCLVFVFLIVTPKIKAFPTQELEWQISEGDSQIYYYSKRYNIDSEDPFQFQEEIYDENGDLVIVAITKGSTIQYNITIVTPNAIWGKITYNGTITSTRDIIAREGMTPDPIRKSVNNRSYWEEYCKEDENSYLSGDLVEHEVTYIILSTYTSIIEIWNWKTGWITYYYEKSWNRTHVLDEIEYSTNPIVNNRFFIPPNMIFGTSFLIVIAILLAGPKLYQKRKIKGIEPPEKGN